MSALIVKPVETNRERQQFLQLPWQLHSRDPHWVPPLRLLQKQLVGYKPHPFHLDAQVQTFLATRAGQPVGRIAAIINQAHNRRYQDQLGFFGFFECVDDVEVSRGLFTAARQWLAERGLPRIRGPMNPSTNYELGLLIQGFDSPPTFMMTYNPAYYERLVEDFGFRKVQDMFAFWGHLSMMETLDKKLAFVFEESKRRFGVQLRKLNRKRFEEDVRTFLRVYNESLGGTWGFVPLSEAELDHMSKELKYLIVPEMTSIAEVQGKPVGTAFGMLDYNPLIKKIDGRLFPFGFLRLLWERKRLKRIRVLSTNVMPEYQRWGLGLVLLVRMVPEAMQYGITECEFSWVLESNHLSRASLERGGAKLTKVYRIYDYPGPEQAA